MSRARLRDSPGRASPRRSRRCRPPARSRPRCIALHTPSSIEPRPGAYTSERPLAASREHQRHVVAGLRRARGAGSTGAGLEAHRDRPPANARDASEGEGAAVGAHHAPLDAAVVPEHAEDRVAARQVRIGVVGAPDGRAAASTRAACKVQWCGRSAHRPARCRRWPCRARPRRLQHGVRPQLREDVGGGIDERPGLRISAADGDRGLRAGVARNVPLRTPEQLRQLQFHWGKPPPAADPSTRIFTVRIGRHPGHAPFKGLTEPERQAPSPHLSLPIRDVHRDFHTETEINRLWGFPTHGPYSCSRCSLSTRPVYPPRRPRDVQRRVMRVVS